MDIRYSAHPDHAEAMDTEQLRDEFLIQNLFQNDEITMTYSHVDRVMVLGALPVNKILNLEAGKEMGSEFFLERREMGIINVGSGSGRVITESASYDMGFMDGLYLGKGTKTVAFESADNKNPARFYMVSSPAHKELASKIITINDAKQVKLGTLEESNKRTIYQYLHPAVLETCQLVMGLTQLEPGCVWNTMPVHTHERRMEVYFYFQMPENGVVFHLMGKPEETRHIVMRNEEAVISPSWSIHSGVGTSSYTFIWGMAGENQTFTDMDHVSMADIK